mgnify:CR=1 FL=1
MFSEEQLTAVRNGELDTLSRLDEQGLCLGSGESCEQYAERLQKLTENIEKMDSALDESGCFEIEGLELRPSNRVSEENFNEVADITGERYRFSIDWVPGFYINPSNSWLFGGCAFYFFPDFFVVFILRRSFHNKRKWLIYDRRELIAHELCHVARIGIDDGAYEEHFAYRTSFSGFRQLIGGMFHSPKDSFLLLSSAFILLGAQLLKVLVLPWLWLWPFWLLVGCSIGGLGLRHWLSCRKLQKAAGVLSNNGVEDCDAVLFRCTDEEISCLAKFKDSEKFKEWVQQKRAEEPRWQVIAHRFMPHCR